MLIYTLNNFAYLNNQILYIFFFKTRNMSIVA